MISKLASFSGFFTPLIKNGDFVTVRQVIGSILFGDPYRQLANADGEIASILSAQNVRAGTVLCRIDDNATNWEAASHALYLVKMTKRKARKHKRKAAKKKVVKKTSNSAPKKAVKKKAAKKAQKNQ